MLVGPSSEIHLRIVSFRSQLLAELPSIFWIGHTIVTLQSWHIFAMSSLLSTRSRHWIGHRIAKLLSIFWSRHCRQSILLIPQLVEHSKINIGLWKWIIGQEGDHCIKIKACRVNQNIKTKRWLSWHDFIKIKNPPILPCSSTASSLPCNGK